VDNGVPVCRVDLREEVMAEKPPSIADGCAIAIAILIGALALYFMVNEAGLAHQRVLKRLDAIETKLGIEKPEAP
jgi:hypothetical protein